MTEKTPRKPRSTATKKKIGKANKGKLAGNNNPMFGQTHSPEIKEKLSLQRQGCIWISNPLTQKTKFVPESQFPEFFIDGWERGREF